MAESDAASPPVSGTEAPAPKAPRSLTLAEIQRDIARQMEPLLAAQREAERGMAPVLAAAKAVERHHQQITAMVDRAIGPYLRAIAGSPSQKKAIPPSRDSAGEAAAPPAAVQTHAAPTFGDSPAARSALVDTVAAEVLKTLAGSLTSETAEFKEEIRSAIADEVRKAFAEAAESKKDRKPRGDSTCERLRDLHKNIDPEFAETASLRKLAKRIDRSTGAIDGSTYYQTKLKPVRTEIAARKKEAKRAQKWGDFNSLGRLDEADEDH